MLEQIVDDETHDAMKDEHGDDGSGGFSPSQPAT
jgi:hypothetical protein